MSELRSAVDSLRAEVLAELPDQRIEEDFAELQRTMEQLEVERLRRLAELDRRRPFHVDGFLSTASWLASAFKVAWGAARQQVREARALEDMPETKTWARGRRPVHVGGPSTGRRSRCGSPGFQGLREGTGGSSPDPLDGRPPAHRGLLAAGGGTRAGARGGREAAGAAAAARIGDVPRHGTTGREPGSRDRRDAAHCDTSSTGRGIALAWRGGRTDGGSASRGRPGRDLAAMARPGGSAHGRGREAT